MRVKCDPQSGSERNEPGARDNLRIVCISDAHGLHRRLAVPNGDILIHAGDFMVHGRSVGEIDDFNDWLGGLPHNHRIVIAGNHDLLFATSPTEARAHLANAVYLESTGTAVAGIRFWGCPVTPVLNHMAFAVERGAASRKYWDRIPADTDVLITHGPPFGTLDKDGIGGPHMGCQELMRAVIKVKPDCTFLGTCMAATAVRPGQMERLW